jgi:hypothetical protein
MWRHMASLILCPVGARIEGSGMKTFIKNCWANSARPLVGLRELLAGPPLTEQERNRQTLTEARVRNAADLHGFYQSPF